MKRIFSVALLSLIGLVSIYAQNVVNLKNGSIIRGELVEYIPHEKVSIKTSDGSLFVYTTDEVESVMKDENHVAAPRVSERFSAPRGYRGFVDVTPFDVTFRGLAFSVNTTHGYQFNHYAFVGGGVGLSMKYNGYYSIPIYASFKGNAGKGAVQFTYGINWGLGLGKDLFTEDFTDPVTGEYGVKDEVRFGTSFYSSYGIGMRFPINPDFAMKLTSEMDFYLGTYSNLSWGIGIGFEF